MHYIVFQTLLLGVWSRAHFKQFGYFAKERVKRKERKRERKKKSAFNFRRFESTPSFLFFSFPVFFALWKLGSFRPLSRLPFDDSSLPDLFLSVPASFPCSCVLFSLWLTTQSDLGTDSNSPCFPQVSSVSFFCSRRRRFYVLTILSLSAAASK